MIMSMSQERDKEISEKIGYYDDDERNNAEMPEMRPRVDKTEAGSASPVSELQADPVGHTITVGTVYILETEDHRYIKVGYTLRMSMRFAQHKAFATKTMATGLRLIGFFPGTTQTEARIHSYLAECRYRTEWYYREPALSKLVRLFDDPIPEKRIDMNPAAVALGRLGGKKKVPKGLAMLTPEERRERARAGAAARWAKAGGRGRKKAK